MRTLRKARWIAAALFLAAASAAFARSVCVEVSTGDCTYYRSCCFYGDNGESHGCWQMYFPCVQ